MPPHFFLYANEHAEHGALLSLRFMRKKGVSKREDRGRDWVQHLTHRKKHTSMILLFTPVYESVVPTYPVRINANWAPTALPLNFRAIRNRLYRK